MTTKDKDKAIVATQVHKTPQQKPPTLCPTLKLPGFVRLGDEGRSWPPQNFHAGKFCKPCLGGHLQNADAPLGTVAFTKASTSSSLDMARAPTFVQQSAAQALAKIPTRSRS